MKIAISQPAYLPWIGYFDLMDQVETFVLLDTVQFQKQSWQQRNRIKTPSGLQWLTVPVLFRGHFGQKIVDVEIRDPQFWRSHLRAIELNYRRAPFFNEYFPDLEKLLKHHSMGKLFYLTQPLIDWFCHVLGVKGNLLRSSQLAASGKRSELLVAICRALSADSYLSPLGSAIYLMDDLKKFADAGIDVAFHHYLHPEYHQLFPPFQSYASALDLIFNEGPSSLEILRSGRRSSYTPSEIGAGLVEAKK